MLPAGYLIRRPSPDDLEPIAALIRTCQQADRGASSWTVEDTATAWQTLDAERNAWLVADAERGVVGYAALRAWVPAQMSAAVGVLPEHRGLGLGTALIGLLEERAGEVLPDAPDEAEVTLDQVVGQHNDTAGRLLEAHGYSFARRFWEMNIDLSGHLPDAEWPEGVRVERLVPGRDRAVFDLIQDAFRGQWGHVDDQPYENWRSWMVERESFDPSLWFLGWAGDELAGGSLCELRDDGAGWVNVLAVRRDLRGRGLGLGLLRHSFREFRARGIERAGLDVDSENPTGATRLYERAGLRVTRHADGFRKVLRAGG